MSQPEPKRVKTNETHDDDDGDNLVLDTPYPSPRLTDEPVVAPPRTRVPSPSPSSTTTSTSTYGRSMSALHRKRLGIISHMDREERGVMLGRIGVDLCTIHEIRSEDEEDEDDDDDDDSFIASEDDNLVEEDEEDVSFEDDEEQEEDTNEEEDKEEEEEKIKAKAKAKINVSSQKEATTSINSPPLLVPEPDPSASSSSLDILITADAIQVSNPTPTPKPEQLNARQRDFLQLVDGTQANIFLTGGAGTGKTHVLRKAIAILQRNIERDHALEQANRDQLQSDKQEEEEDTNLDDEDIVDMSTDVTTPLVAVTATTAVAAVHISGITLHSFFGKLVMDEDEPGKAPYNYANWVLNMQTDDQIKFRSLRALIIDEVSMLLASTLTRIDHGLKAFRNSRAPFGGVRVIFCGDFFQLPPVFQRNMNDPERSFIPYAFKSDAWIHANLHTVDLRKIVRQKDPAFASILSRLRVGQLLPEDARTLNKRVMIPGRTNFSLLPDRSTVKLFAQNKDVDQINNSVFERQPGKAYSYFPDGLFTAMPYWSLVRGKCFLLRQRERFFARRQSGLVDIKCTRITGMTNNRLGNTLPVMELHLKVGLRVMLRANLDTKAGLVNGACGVIVAFETMPPPDIATASKLSKQAEMMAGSNNMTWGPPRGNVSVKWENDDREWPVVQFDNGLRAVITQHATSQPMTLQDVQWIEALGKSTFSLSDKDKWRRKNYASYTLAVPLQLCAAITIHKSQGQTLHSAVVSLKNAYATHQPYTALSRISDLNGLFLTNMVTSGDFRVEPTVRAFYRQIEMASLDEEDEDESRASKSAKPYPKEQHDAEASSSSH